MADSFPDAFLICISEHYGVSIINYHFTNKQTGLDELVLGSQLAGACAVC